MLVGFSLFYVAVNLYFNGKSKYCIQSLFWFSSMNNSTLCIISTHFLFKLRLYSILFCNKRQQKSNRINLGVGHAAFQHHQFKRLRLEYHHNRNSCCIHDHHRYIVFTISQIHPFHHPYTTNLKITVIVVIVIIKIDISHFTYFPLIKLWRSLPAPGFEFINGRHP